MKQQIERIAWREMVWNRPFSLQDVYAALLHLASLTPRGAVVFEIRGGNGKIRYFLGADSLYIHRVENVFQTQGQVQFADLPPEARQGTYAARQLKISHPVLSLNTDTTQAAIRAALAAMAGCKSSMVVQVVFGRSFSPSSVPAELPDPEAGWVNILRGCVPKASAETRRSVRAKAEEYSFQAVIRLGTSDPQPQLLNGLLSAFKTLESAGVKIRGETESPEKITNAHVPWSFPLRLSVKELASFLLLPAGEEELPGVAGVNPRTILLPNWYKTPTAASQTRTFGVSLDTPPKPDLFAVTVSGAYEDRWFVEVDLATESPAKVIEKCQRYHAYYRTGLEQEESGVFPLTVWIVPTNERKERLIEHIRKAFDKQPRLFAVITQKELKNLIRNGGDGGALC